MNHSIKKSVCIFLLFVARLAVYSQHVGIGTASPNSSLDVNGDWALRSQNLIVTGGVTYALDVHTLKSSNYRLAGPTSNFVIAGITAGVDGRVITLYNRSGHSMELYDEDVNATTINRIRTGIGTTLAIFNNGNVTLQYDAAVNRWEVLSKHNSSLDNFNTNNLPATAIVFSDVSNNANLTGANFSPDGETQLTVTQYQPNTYGWGTPPSTTNAPTFRGEHTAVWTGDKLLIWGGYDAAGGIYLSDGYIYDNSANAWTNMASNSLAVRSLHTAQWTGTEMLIWGGVGTVQTMGDGAKYNPATNVWASISTVNAPTSRFDFTSVWTGSEMIVFGGRFAGTNFRADHKRYNPATNNWSTVSNTNAPLPRIHHTAVWTGARMIVYGGKLSDGTIVNTGYTYDPVTDSWASISTAGAPPNGNAEHTAVWTGTEMIVFGGRKHPAGTENNLYLYNPATDTWRQGASLHMPLGTIYHSAVWTGTEMIVYGGLDGVIGIYNPVSDSWFAGTLNNPYGFSKHTATMVADDMIVVGNEASQRFRKGILVTSPKTFYLYKKN